jgi:hypothetical protein
VVALGLSAGFLEPLESTSIFLIQRGLSKLIDLMLAGEPLTEQVVAGYNDLNERQFARVRDFLILHYCLSGRRDSALWRAMTSMELPETLAFKIRAWRQTGKLHQYDVEGFDATSWLAIHAGMGHWPEHVDAKLGAMTRAEALEGLQWRRKCIVEAVAAMPKHDAYLRAMLGRK